MTVIELRQSKRNLEQTMDSCNQMNNGHDKLRSVERKCARCIVIFAITWTPYCLYLMIDALGHETGVIIQTFCQVSILLRFVHYITNPWMLLLGSKTFRNESKKVISSTMSGYGSQQYR